MAYPEALDSFTEKLNKKTDGSVYVIEEELIISDGVYNGPLAHDSINKGSIRVFTGPRFTGDEIHNFILSIPAETPWQMRIKVFSDADVVYVTYETPGDTVEAEDINRVQDSIVVTQSEIERYKTEGTIDGGYF